jgi:hypothetical protein
MLSVSATETGRNQNVTGLLRSVAEAEPAPYALAARADAPTGRACRGVLMRGASQNRFEILVPHGPLQLSQTDMPRRRLRR